MEENKCPKCGAPCSIGATMDEIPRVVDADTHVIYVYKPPAGAVWVKATTRLPEKSGSITWRWIDKEASYSGYDEKRGFIYDKGGASIDPLYNIEVEWLDESGTAAGREEELWEAFENELYEIYRREGLANAASKAHSQVYLLKVKFKQKEK